MPRVALNEIMLRTLKPTPGKQVQYWDRSLPSFGVRVGQRTKTFNVMRDKQRRLIKIGSYPAMTLAEARRAAHNLIDNSAPTSITFPAACDLFCQRHLDALTLLLAADDCEP